MMVPKQKIVDGLGEFMRLDLFPAMPDGMAKFAANMVLAAFRNNPDGFINSYLPFMKMLGVTEDGSSYDVDSLSTYLREAMAASGSLTIAGFKLDSSDIDKLIGRIRQ